MIKQVEKQIWYGNECSKTIELPKERMIET